jgi:hypothetical protein
MRLLEEKAKKRAWRENGNGTYFGRLTASELKRILPNQERRT